MTMLAQNRASTPLNQSQRRRADPAVIVPGRSAASVPRWLRVTMPLLALALGAAHTTVAISQQSMNEDGINYLDIGTAFVAGDWQAAVNAVWSPLYPLLIGTVVGIVQPSVWWEFPVVQIVNCAVFTIALACFAFFWRCLTATCVHTPDVPLLRVPPALWLVFGYSLFIWSSLNLINVWSVTPDMMVAAVIYLSAGLLLLVSREPASRMHAILLGAVLGVGYLAKAALFPLGLLAIALTGALGGTATSTFRRTALAVVAFAAVAGPYMLLLSVTSGRPTFGDAGRFTYMKHVNELRYPDWGESLRQVDGTPIHGPRRLFANPPVFEFAAPVPGTYPLAFDPGYWTEGLSPRLDARQQMRALVRNGARYFDLFIRSQGAVTAVMIVLGIVVGLADRRLLLRREAILVAWAIGAFVMYALVHVEGRYVAPFVVLLWSGLLAGVRLPPGPGFRQIGLAAGFVLVGAIWINIAAANVEGLQAISPALSLSPAEAEFDTRARGSENVDAAPASNPAIAEALFGLGLQHGDRVAYIGHSFTAFWARLARLRIVAAVEPQDTVSFWNADPSVRADILNRLRLAGAVAVVASPAPANTEPTGWQPVARTGYLFLSLR